METKSKNLKLFPFYRQFSMDLILFYTINIIFLMEVKHFATAYVVLSETLYTVFVVVFQLFAAKIIEKLGVVKSSFIANVFNSLYLIIFMLCRNPLELYIGEAVCALAFSIKDVSDNVILNESIEAEKKEKSKILANVQSKAVANYYLISSITLLFSGFLYNLNPYIPFIISFAICILTTFLATRFHEIHEDKNLEDENDKKNNESTSLKEAFKYVFKSKRTLSIVLYSALINSVILVLISYETALLEELNTSPVYIGILFAILNLVSAIASKAQMAFQMKYKNRTLTVISIILCISVILSGIVGSLHINPVLAIAIISILYIFKFIACGLIRVFVVKYLSNFTNDKIDVQLYTIRNLLDALAGSIGGFLAAGLVVKFSVANSFIIYGIVTSLCFAILLTYMKKRFGLKPEEYSEIDLKYDNK